eukprot:TRINITY_DN2183_c0_g4_i1.p1 TRINITY_DN2183_c0_g4~~TRINITY_DN2183_c0_g4_i1.p1  ORF type:complete len:301 (+),score=19.24 TRINITY_DN2183_c0_g4_i1:715-1617(+)
MGRPCDHHLQEAALVLTKKTLDRGLNGTMREATSAARTRSCTKKQVQSRIVQDAREPTSASFSLTIECSNRHVQRPIEAAMEDVARVFVPHTIFGRTGVQVQHPIIHHDIEPTSAPSPDLVELTLEHVQPLVVRDLLRQSQRLEDKGKHREAADKCRDAYQEATHSEGTGSFVALALYAKFFRQNVLEASSRDVQCFSGLGTKGFASNLDRCFAMETLEVMATSLCDTQPRGWYLRRTIALADLVKDERDYKVGHVRAATWDRAKVVMAKRLAEVIGSNARQRLEEFESLGFRNEGRGEE